MNRQTPPEVHISLLKVRLHGEAAIAAAGWTVQFAMICRAISALMFPYVTYLLLRVPN